MIIKFAGEHLPGDEYENPKDQICGEDCFFHEPSEKLWVHEHNGHKLDDPKNILHGDHAIELNEYKSLHQKCHFDIFIQEPSCDQAQDLPGPAHNYIHHLNIFLSIEPIRDPKYRNVMPMVSSGEVIEISFPRELLGVHPIEYNE
jgi:hypothetical protein